MYLWDSNIVRHFGEGHKNLVTRLRKIPWMEIALPSVVVAEILRGRCDYALKAPPEQLPQAHALLLETKLLLNQFNVVVFDEDCLKALESLKQKHKMHKRYADLVIAAIAKSGDHIIVTRNEKDFKRLLPKAQIVNWIDN